MTQKTETGNETQSPSFARFHVEKMLRAHTWRCPCAKASVVSLDLNRQCFLLSVLKCTAWHSQHLTKKLLILENALNSRTAICLK